ncbi:MAG TPA: type II toxin-antitoxin system mRNA interferase toxin, RelE/StbE family [Candidatus Paceibacterota bacterium]|nr:type II toxin-antitoxin system mRNA interferase toxin, RelE/StbE family [Candidatus Paceibacterota bacterium]
MEISGIIFHKRFEKTYAKQSRSVQDAFIERKNVFLRSPESPALHNHPLNGEWSGYRSINVTGDVRAVYILSGTVAVFVAIGTHSKLYR